MSKAGKRFFGALYYLVGIHLPQSYTPVFGKLGKGFRRMCARRGKIRVPYPSDDLSPLLLSQVLLGEEGISKEKKQKGIRSEKMPCSVPKRREGAEGNAA